MLRVTAYLLDFDDTFTVPAILFLLSAVAFVLFGPFFKVLQERHDVVTVYASYLIWLVVIGVPFGVMEIGTGTPYTDATYFMLIVASAFTIVGAMTIGFYADEDGISLELQTLKPAI
jgi:amino acid transporter